MLARSKPGSAEVDIVPPRRVARELNQRFPMEEAGGAYFTLLYGIMDIDARQFRYISAGHPTILHQPREREPCFLKGDGFAIGWGMEDEYDEYTVQLEPGDRLFLYSDGVPEALNGRLEEFGNERLLEVCRQTSAEDLQMAVEHLLQAIERWCGDSGPKDDISILATEMT
jgi:sigma-B regulation protein RsbU (phosphoserine phosphatase)